MPAVDMIPVLIDLAAHMVLGALFGLGWSFVRISRGRALGAATLTAVLAGVLAEVKEEGPTLEWSDFAAANWLDVAEYALGGVLVVPLVRLVRARLRHRRDPRRAVAARRAPSGRSGKGVGAARGEHRG